MRTFLALCVLLLLSPVCASEPNADSSSINSARPITLKHGEGTILLSRDKQEFVETVSAGAKLPDGVSILTPEKGYADLSCKGLLIRVWSDSAVQLNLTERTLYLLRGHAMIYVSKQYKGKSLRLCTEKYFCDVTYGCYGIGSNQFLQQEKVAQHSIPVETSPGSSIRKLIASSRFHKYCNSISMHR